MLIDRVVIEVRSGNGGNGALSFLQEKNMPKGKKKARKDQLKLVKNHNEQKPVEWVAKP